MSGSRFLTGPGVVLYVNGKLYAQVMDFNWRIGTPREEVAGIDAIEAFELGVTRVRVTGQLVVYRRSQDGGAEGAGMVAPLSELTRERYASFVLVDRISGVPILQAPRCSVESQSWRAAPKSYLVGTIDFTGIEAANEVGG